MTYIYKDDHGNVYTKEELKQLDVCDVCGEPAEELEQEEDIEHYIDGEHPTLHGTGINTRLMSICFGCLEDGVSKEELEKALSD